jgi:hypothetical protein
MDDIQDLQNGQISIWTMPTAHTASAAPHTACNGNAQSTEVFHIEFITRHPRARYQGRWCCVVNTKPQSSRLVAHLVVKRRSPSCWRRWAGVCFDNCGVQQDTHVVAVYGGSVVAQVEVGSQRRQSVRQWFIAPAAVHIPLWDFESL